MEELNFEAVLEDAFSAVLDAITASLETLAEAVAATTEAMTVGFAESADSAAALQSVVDGLAANVASVAGGMDVATAATDENTAATDDNTAAKLGNKDANEKMAESAKTMLMPLGIATLAVVGVGAAAVHMAGDFEEGLTTLVTGAGESATNLGMIHDGLLNMSESTGESTKQLVDGMFMIESSGAHGKKALLELQAAAEGAKVGNADLGSMANALTTVLANYGSQGITAAQATNDLISIVSHGKSHMQDLAASISGVLPAAAKYGVSLSDTSAALATMTAQNGDASTSVTYLRQLLTAMAAPSKGAQKALEEIGLSAQQVSDGMKKDLPGTLQLITDHINSTFKPGSIEANEAFKTIAGGSKQMQGMLLLTGQGMDTFKRNAKDMAAGVKQGGDSIQGWALVQKDFNTQLSQGTATLSVAMINLGEAIAPVAQEILQQVTPALKSVGEWVSSHGQQTATIFEVLAAVLGGALVAALGAAATAFATMDLTALPVIAIGAAVAGLAVGVALAYTHFKPFRDVVQDVGKGLATFWSILQPIGKEIAGQITPIFQQLGGQLKSELAPAWASLVSAFNTAKPALQVIGAILGVVLVGAIGLLIGILSGLAVAFAQVVAGTALFLGGLIQAIAGFVKLFVDYWSGLFTIIVDLFTGNWSKLGTDTHNWLMAMWGDVVQIGTGLWNAIKGIWQASIGAIIGYVQGFVAGIVGWFTHLWDKLVGHSIIPDMINGIVAWFEQLPGRAGAAVGNLASSLLSTFTGLASNATQWGENLIQNFINGIKNMAGGVASAASGIAKNVSSFLGFHSPAEQGPGADADQWEPNLMRMFASTMLEHGPLVGAAAQTVAGTVAGALGTGVNLGGGSFPAGLLAAGAAGGLGGGGPLQVTVVLKDDTGIGGFSAGMKLLDPQMRSLFAREIAEEIAKQGFMQGRQPIGYTGSR